MATRSKSLRVALAVGAAGALLVGVADAAFVRVGDIVLRADGGFKPLTLPRRAFAPIRFHGHASIARRGGGVPPAVLRAVIDFDRDGRLHTAGLARCAPSRIEESPPAEARRTCRRAIVGTGRIEALVAIAGLPPASADSPLTLFNGPRKGRVPTVVAHARFTSPVQQTFAVTVPVQRRRGPYRYRATVDVPPIAPGLAEAAFTRLRVRIGRRFRARGRVRSYVAARCSDNVLETRGRFTFSDGTIVDGAVAKGCRARNGP